MSSNWISTVIDWDTCKIQYEILGDSLERIAQTHELPLSSIQRVATDEGWQQLSKDKNQDSAVPEYLKKTLNSFKIKLSFAAIYREMELFPKIAAAEDSLLEKIKSAIHLVDVSDPRAASSLRALGQGLNAIAERKTMDIFEELGDGEDVDTQWTVEVKKATKVADHLERQNLSVVSN